ncbi:FtsX-like permease family protein [Mumia zhuanghuii]|uniref:ABC transporter permease n=2 Tax=Mumia TaxID=1546255 RepID=A0ABW1QQW0_9ACTN|nr:MULTISPECIES: FtsX-like permease family protein [Mumia]KAA1422158.1 FtsX-like permease family protein [Mumia zhuanghuii]
MRTVLWGSLRAHARRYVTAAAAIVMAVAFMVAVNALSGAAREGLRADVVAQYAGADLVVDVSSDDRATAGEVGERVREVDGVAAAVVNASGYADVAAGTGERMMSVGTLASDEALRWQEVVEGTAPGTPDEALIAQSSADRYGVALGDSVSVAGEQVVVSGFSASPGGTLGASVYVSEAVAARLGDALIPSDVSVRTASGADEDAVASALDAAASADGPHPVADRDAWVDARILDATKDVDVLQRLVLVFAAIAAFVGTLVIANTITIVLTQRRRELALLRCVGATRRQIVRALRTESAVLGATAALAGVLLGWGLGHVAVAALKASDSGVALGAVALTPAGVAVPFVIGVLAAVGATVLPVRRVSRLAPLEALRPHETTGLSGRPGRIRVVSGVALVGLGAAGLVVGTGDLLPVGLAGGMAAFLGVVVLAPLLVPAVLRLVGPAVAATGVAGRLASANVVRNPRRTASTATALLIGVTLITMVVVGTASLRTTVDRELDRDYALDAAVVATEEPLADGIEARVADIDGVGSVATLPGAEVEMDGHEVLVLEVGPAAAGILHGDAALPRSGELVVGGELADALDLSFGASSHLRTAAGEVAVRPRWGGSLGEVALVAPGVLADLGASVEPRAVWVRGADGASGDEVLADAAAIAEPAGAAVAGSLSQRSWITLQMDVMLAVTVGLLAVAVLIAVIGMAGTLSLSVLERSRENALLRALGLTRRGLRGTMAAEALLMAGVAAVLGTALGGVFAWLGVRALTEGLIDDLSFTVPWFQVAVVLVAATATGLLASVLPARRATRVAPAEGIAML